MRDTKLNNYSAMEEMLKKYGISKELFLKVTQFIKLQVDQNIVYTSTDQEQMAAEILIMASEGMNVKTGEKQCNLPVVMPRFSVSLVYQNVESVMLRTLILNAKDNANALLETIEYFKKETDGMGLILKTVTEINEA